MISKYANLHQEKNKQGHPFHEKYSHPISVQSTEQ